MRSGLWSNSLFNRERLGKFVSLSGIVQAELEGLDPTTRTLNVLEEGGAAHPYKISREGAAAIADHLPP